MPNVTAMVVQLDNGKYRSVKLAKVKSIYTDVKYRCEGTIQQGEDDVLGPERDLPDWTPQASSSGTTRAGNGEGISCYYVNGILVCL